MPPLDLAALRGRVPPAPLTRFAPSPTGYLHLGHVVNAIWVWGVARGLGGRVLLRIEDHDRGRSRAAFERATLEDLEWLGLVPDVGSPDKLRGASPFRQSDCGETYREAVNRLRRSERVYACDCSRREIAREAGDVFDQETRYPGRCRERGLAERESFGVRVVLPERTETFTDVRLGPTAQTPARQCGDLLLRDRTGPCFSTIRSSEKRTGPSSASRAATPASGSCVRPARLRRRCWARPRGAPGCWLDRSRSGQRTCRGCSSDEDQLSAIRHPLSGKHTDPLPGV